MLNVLFLNKYLLVKKIELQISKCSYQKNMFHFSTFFNILWYKRLKIFVNLTLQRKKKVIVLAANFRFSLSEEHFVVLYSFKHFLSINVLQIFVKLILE